MTISETTDDTFRLSTAECFQLPEVFFALKNVQSECRMLSERVVNNCNFNEMGMYISFIKIIESLLFLACFGNFITLFAFMLIQIAQEFLSQKICV